MAETLLQGVCDLKGTFSPGWTVLSRDTIHPHPTIQAQLPTLLLAFKACSEPRLPDTFPERRVDLGPTVSTLSPSFPSTKSLFHPLPFHFLDSTGDGGCFHLMADILTLFATRHGQNLKLKLSKDTTIKTCLLLRHLNFSFKYLCGFLLHFSSAPLSHP